MEIPWKKAWIKLTVDPVFDSGGNVVGAIHYLSDITRSREAEEERNIEVRRLQLLNRLGNLVLREPHLDSVLKEMLKDVKRSLELSRCAVRLFEDPERTAEICAPGVPPTDSNFHIYKRIAQGKWKSPLDSIVVNNVSETIYDDETRERIARLHIGAFLGIPLLNGQEQTGFLYMCKGLPHEWSGTEIAIAETVASSISLAVRHSKVSSKQKETAGRLVSLLNNIPGVVYRGLPDWSIVFIGADVRRMTGYLPEEFLMGTFNWKNLIHPDDLERVKRTYRDAVREQRRVMRVEYRTLHRDGSIRWIVDRRQHFYDEKGIFTYVDGLLLDITDRRKIEDERSEIERRFQAIADTASDAIISMDSSGRVVFANRSAEKMFGYAIDELSGGSLTRLIPARYRGAHEEGLARFLKTGEGRVLGKTVELHGLKKDGAEFPIELSLATWEIEDGVFFTGIVRDITARKLAAEEFRATHEKLQSLLEASPIPIMALSKDGIVTSWNPSAESVFGWSRDEVIGRFNPMVSKEKVDEFRQLRERAIRENGFSGVEVRRKKKDGSDIDIRLATGSIKDPDGTVVGIVAIMEDITERLRMEKALRESEEQLRQSQKIEAVGQLAGGVAHDFNNLLTAIRGYSELLLHRLDASSPLRREVEEIQKAGDRAASLTRQLLAFSRKQILQPKVLDLNSVVANMEGMLRRLIGEDIDLVAVLRPDIWNVTVDPGQIEQVIMNIVVNARDAMPKGGKVVIETSNVMVDDAYALRRAVVKPGEYVLLAISDTGEGMSESTKMHLFEPFFTTKEKGKGTGLGLSTVYGIVKQSGGYIWVYSEPGKGSAFKVYLPRAAGISETKIEPGRRPLPRGKEIVLVVEDDEAVRNLIGDILRGGGYKVIAAADGGEAVKIGNEHEGPIHLVLTDVVMPKMGGREAAECLTQSLPDVKVLYMSGYTDDAIVRHGVLDPGIPFIQKPFTPEAILRKVRELLDGPPAV
jgi:PAS domain S-box-containing protein